MQRIRCQPSNFSRLPWHLGPHVAPSWARFFALVGVKAEASSPEFCRESDISGRKHRKTVKAACHAKFWGSAAIYTNCLFNFSRLPWHLGPHFASSLGPFFASVAVKAEASRPEFCRESNIEGRKQREDGICRESGARRPETPETRGHQLQEKCGIPAEATRHLRKISSIPEEQKPLGTSPGQPLENFYTMF